MDVAIQDGGRNPRWRPRPRWRQSKMADALEFSSVGANSNCREIDEGILFDGIISFRDNYNLCNRFDEKFQVSRRGGGPPPPALLGYEKFQGLVARHL